jgi:hypothetical protein
VEDGKNGRQEVGREEEKWEEIRGEKWSSGRWEDVESGKGINRKEENERR